MSINNEYRDFVEIYGNFLTTANIQRPKIKDYTFSKEALPSVRDVYLKQFVTDPDLRKIDKATIPNNIVNRTVLFLADNTANSYADMSSSIMIGENIIVTIENKKGDKAKLIIDDWNDNINMKHQTIEKFMKSAFKDCLINGEFLWRVYINKKPDIHDPIVDIQRVSLASVQKEEHDTLGAIRWIQRGAVYKKPLNKKQFYRKDPIKHTDMREIVTIIPNEINCALHLKLFDQAPTATIIEELSIKRWAYMFLRKYIEKYWAPFIIAYVGDAKNGYLPRDPKEMKDQLTWAAQQIRMIRDFGGAAFPVTTQLTTLETNAKRDSNIYLGTIDHLSKEIAIGLHASISTRDSDKQSKAGQDIAMQGYIRNMRSMREEFSILMRRFYAHVLLPAYGIDGIKPREIKITFPEIQNADAKSIAEAVEIAAKTGVFKDWREIRKIFNPIWKHIDENLTDSEAKEMKKLFLEINSPSRAEGDVPQQRASSSANKPKK